MSNDLTFRARSNISASGVRHLVQLIRIIVLSIIMILFILYIFVFNITNETSSSFGRMMYLAVAAVMAVIAAIMIAAYYGVKYVLKEDRLMVARYGKILQIEYSTIISVEEVKYSTYGSAFSRGYKKEVEIRYADRSGNYSIIRLYPSKEEEFYEELMSRVPGRNKDVWDERPSSLYEKPFTYDDNDHSGNSSSEENKNDGIHEITPKWSIGNHNEEARTLELLSLALSVITILIGIFVLFNFVNDSHGTFGNSRLSFYVPVILGVFVYYFMKKQISKVRKAADIKDTIAVKARFRTGIVMSVLLFAIALCIIWAITVLFGKL